MQTIVCQTAESLSPDLQMQTLQKPREKENSRESDFLSMLNENLKKEEPVKESGQTPANEKMDEAEKPKESEISMAKDDDKKAAPEEKVQEKESPKEIEKTSKKDEPKKLVKKEPLQEKGEQKIDAFIQGALAKKEPQKVQAKGQEKKLEKSGVKKIALDSDAKKIDPRQAEFLRKISEKENSPKKEKVSFEKNLLDAKEESQNAASQNVAALEGQEAFVQGQKIAESLSKNNEENSFEERKSSAVKKTDKKPVIQVTDLRTKVEAASPKESLKGAKKDFVVSVKENSKASVEMTLDLNDQAQKNIMTMDSQSAASDGSTFQAMLKNQITQNAGDFVRAGNIVLRDNNQGQINLILHPEELGNVKISMEMNGKSIVGHITVASKEAMEAFGQSADALRNAFIQSGFEDATFDVSFAGSQMQFAQGQGQEDAQGKAMQGRKIYGEFTQESLTSAEENSDNFIDDDVSINIVA
ncbi:MAG: flagellar hook-length control protein FliK [Treponema sp.]|nr:flagellar hook-length control protein FliK [Treponema sp.]